MISLVCKYAVDYIFTYGGNLFNRKATVLWSTPVEALRGRRDDISNHWIYLLSSLSNINQMRLLVATRKQMENSVQMVSSLISVPQSPFPNDATTKRAWKGQPAKCQTSIESNARLFYRYSIGPCTLCKQEQFDEEKGSFPPKGPSRA